MAYFFNNKVFLIIFCLLIGKNSYSAEIYTGKDFISSCKDQNYVKNQKICNTAITQAFSSYLVSIELFGGEKLAKCYRKYYPFLEKKTVKDGVLFLSKQYDENPELTKHLMGFGFSVLLYSKYPIPLNCIKFKQPGVSK